MDRILSKILNYESSIFEEYSSKRKDLIEHIKTIENLDKEQTLIFVNDLKAIIDPVKISISEIDHYFTNLNFKNDKNKVSFEELNKFLLCYLLFDLRFGSDSTEALETEISESESSSESSDSLSVSLSDSESKSSRSVSVTFSNEN